MSAIIIPPGFRKPDVIELPAGLMKRVIEFAAIAAVRAMGLHCGLCGADFRASNDEHAPIYTMACKCREFWSTNPDGPTH